MKLKVNFQREKLVLIKLRGCKDVAYELNEIDEGADELPFEKIRFHDVVNKKKFHWPVIFAVVLHSAQHFCGIEAVKIIHFP